MLWSKHLLCYIPYAKLVHVVQKNITCSDHLHCIRSWSDKDISSDHLHVFGCKAFIHDFEDERSKLDAETRPCMFLGYDQDEFNYRLYDLIQKKLKREVEMLCF